MRRAGVRVSSQSDFVFVTPLAMKMPLLSTLSLCILTSQFHLTPSGSFQLLHSLI